MSKVFFELETDKNKKLGKYVFLLYDDVVPKTAANFKALCTG
jgi:peptidylprolyl isomerase